MNLPRLRPLDQLQGVELSFEVARVPQDLDHVVDVAGLAVELDGDPGDHGRKVLDPAVLGDIFEAVVKPLVEGPFVPLAFSGLQGPLREALLVVRLSVVDVDLARFDFPVAPDARLVYISNSNHLLAIFTGNANLI